MAIKHGAAPTPADFGRKPVTGKMEPKAGERVDGKQPPGPKRPAPSPLKAPNRGKQG